jgi:hypothetical protein
MPLTENETPRAAPDPCAAAAAFLEFNVPSPFMERVRFFMCRLPPYAFSRKPHNRTLFSEE